MCRTTWLGLVLLALAPAPLAAHGAGLELPEQSPGGLATAGAQTAVADDASANYYNPAGLAFQRGLNIMAGANLLLADTTQTTTANGSTAATKLDSKTLDVAPTVYVGARLGPHVAIGVGLFANFGQHQDFAPLDNPARFVGYQVKIQAVTINANVAVRPLHWLSIAAGIDVVPSSFEVTQAINFGGGEGSVHDVSTATGIGGNVALLIHAVPRWLDIGLSYRSAVKLDFSGTALVTTPTELASQSSALQNASNTITLPHNMTFALATHPLPHLTVDVDVHLTLWRSFKQQEVTLTDPQSGQKQISTVPLNFRDEAGIRLGLMYRLCNERLVLRIGGGYDRTPVPNASLGPITPDGDRGVVGIGVGYQWRFIGFDAGYLFTYLPTRTTTNQALPGTSYKTVGNVVGLTINLRFDKLGPKIYDARYR